MSPPREKKVHAHKGIHVRESERRRTRRISWQEGGRGPELDPMGGRSDKWRNERRRKKKKGLGRVNRGQEWRRKMKQSRSDASILHGRRSFRVYSSRPEEWTPESFSLVIRDGASCKNRRPPSSMITVRSLTLGKGYRRSMGRRGGTNLFLYLRSWPIIFFFLLSFFFFFTNPFSNDATREGALGAPLFRATVAFLSLAFSPSFVVSLSIPRDSFGVNGPTDRGLRTHGTR